LGPAVSVDLQFLTLATLADGVLISPEVEDARKRLAGLS
jgi:hypothetical protein